MTQVPEVPMKKPYRPPKLIVYGDLTQLTKTNAANQGMLEMRFGNKRT